MGLPTDTWGLIFEPPYREKLKGRVTCLNSQRELMATGLNYLGPLIGDTNAADASNLIGAGKPNAAALPDIEPRLAGERAIFPPAAERQRLEMLRDSEPRQRRLMSPLWTEIKVK